MGCCWLSWSSLSRPGLKLSRLWALKGSQCSWVRNEAPRGSKTKRPPSSAQPWSWPRFGVGGSSSGPLYCLVCLPFPRNPATTHRVLPCGLPFPSQVILPSSPLFPLVKILYPWQFPSPTNKTRPNTVLTASNLGYYEERIKWTYNNVGRIDTHTEIKRLFASLNLYY